MTRKNATARSAAPGPRKMRAATSTTPVASIMSIGWKMSWNCGTPRSNSSWNVVIAMSRPPGSHVLRRCLTHHFSVWIWPVRFMTRTTSTWSTAIPSSAIEAPPMSMRCVGPQSVTSWPKSRCHWSSSGKASSEKLPDANMRMPPSGACQSRVIFTNVGPSFFSGRHIAKNPASTMPYRPTRMK